MKIVKFGGKSGNGKESITVLDIIERKIKQEEKNCYSNFSERKRYG
jgi:hypothetical protein